LFFSNWAQEESTEEIKPLTEEEKKAKLVRMIRIARRAITDCNVHRRSFEQPWPSNDPPKLNSMQKVRLQHL
jgi:hypothetical protein